MFPVQQTRTGFPAGNCTEATYASLLELSLEDVPDLWDGKPAPDDHTWDPEGCLCDHCIHRADEFRSILELIRARGLFLVRLVLVEPVPIPPYQRSESTQTSLVWRAWVRNRVPPEIYEMGKAVWTEFGMIEGDTPAGLGHMVIGRDGGHLIHDLNPNAPGLVSAEVFGFLVPLEEVPEHYRNLHGLNVGINAHLGDQDDT